MADLLAWTSAVFFVYSIIIVSSYEDPWVIISLNTVFAIDGDEASHR